MAILTVQHLTRYRYRQPVALGEHRMMFRPRESYDQRLIETRLKITPQPVELRYFHDVFGNTVGVARFEGRTQELVFESYNRLDHQPDDSLGNETQTDSSLNAFPFVYEQQDIPDLRPSMERSYRDPDRVLEKWAKRFLEQRERVNAPNVLAAMTCAIHEELAYVGRPSGPPQTPLETLELKRGTCRDFAVLMQEAARTLGLRGAVRVWLPLQSQTRQCGVAATRWREHACLGAHLHAERRLGGIRSHEWACRKSRFDPRRGVT